MEKIKEQLNQYKTYILCVIIVILIIIIGFMYSNNVSNKIEEPQEEVKEIKEDIKRIYVDIKGEVKHPGVYELNDNEKVIDVINKAGGLTSNASTNYLNLSKKVKDEMVIIIYSKDEIKKYEKDLQEKAVKEIIKYEVIEKEIPCPNTTNEACINNEVATYEEKEIKETKKIKEENTIDSDSNSIINLNTATKDELLTLPGIGESKADLIIEYRNTNRFNSIEDIKNVKGIGDSLFEKVKNNITV